MIVRIRDVRPSAFQDEREALIWELERRSETKLDPYPTGAPVAYMVVVAGLLGLALVGWTIFTLVGEWVRW